jgi:hypothetical protein
MKHLMLVDIVQVVALLHHHIVQEKSLFIQLLHQILQLMNGLMLLLEQWQVIEILQVIIIKELRLKFKNIEMDLGELLNFQIMI